MGNIIKQLLIALMMLCAVACSQAPDPSGEDQAGEIQTKAADNTPAKVAEAADAGLKVAFVFDAPVRGAGLTCAIDNGRQAVEALGFVQTKVFENYASEASEAYKSDPYHPEKELKRSADHLFDYLNFREFDLIFTEGYDLGEAPAKAAEKYPNLKFMDCMGFRLRPRLNGYQGRLYQASFLAGMVAGKMTRTGTIGYVASFSVPMAIRNINAFTLGVRSVNPAAVVRLSWTRAREDFAKEEAAANALMDAGADIIAQNLDSPYAARAAQERGKYAIGYGTDMSEYARDACITSTIWNWAPLFEETVKAVRDNTWQGGRQIWWGMDTGAVALAPFGPMVPEEVKTLVTAEKEKIIQGKTIVFSGPIQNQDGDMAIPEGSRASDKDLFEMMWLVKGVVGDLGW